MTASVEARLLANSVRTPDGCLEWMRARNSKGYGCISVAGRVELVHRVAHELWVGPIPERHEVDHVYAAGCRSLLCIEPGHLEAVTCRENNLRKVGVHKTHCIRNHDLTGPNLRINRNGHRSCRECARDNSQSRRVLVLTS